MAATYLTEKLQLKKNHALRSDKTSRLKSYGDRAFSMAGPLLWNDLPDHLRLVSNPDTFKRDLKTYLFKKAYAL